jgi:hypothetical protein
VIEIGRYLAEGAERYRVKVHCYVLMENHFHLVDDDARGQPFRNGCGRNWKAWEYRRWVEVGLIGKMEDPFAAVKWQQVGGGWIFAQTQIKDHRDQRVERHENYGPEEKLVSCRSAAGPWVSERTLSIRS